MIGDSKLAKKSGIRAPYNETIYEFGKKLFSKSGFSPMDIQDLWTEIQKKL